MTLAFRKLEMLGKRFEAMEEAAKIQGYATSPIDQDFKAKIDNLMEKVRKF